MELMEHQESKGAEKDAVSPRDVFQPPWATHPHEVHEPSWTHETSYKYI